MMIPDPEVALRKRLAAILGLARDHSRSHEFRVGMMAEQVYQIIGERDDLLRKLAQMKGNHDEPI